MRLLDGLKRFLHGPRSVESVAHDLVEGLRNGDIYLDHLEHEDSAKLANGKAIPETLQNQSCGKGPSEVAQKTIADWQRGESIL